jgi:hypothetical protein
MLTHLELESRKQNRYEETILPTVTTGSAYTAGDCVGGLQTIGSTPSNSAKGPPIEQGGLSLILQSALMVDLDGQNKAMNVWLFNAAPSTPTDKTAYSPSVADMKKLIGLLQFPAASYVTINSKGVCQLVNQGLVIKPTAQQIYAVIQTGASGTPTFTNGIQLKLQFSQGL